MRNSPHIGFLLLFLLGGLSVSAGPLDPKEMSLEEKHRLQPTSAQLRHCPDGHPDLKDVPIKYGLFHIDVAPESQWTKKDRELVMSVKNHQVVLGSDVYFPESPRFQPTCLRCGYYYEVDFVPNDAGRWTKWGTKFDDFTMPFSSVAQGLPFGKDSPLNMSVSVIQNTIVSEFISTTIPLSRKDSLVAETKEWLVKSGFSDRALSQGRAPLSQWTQKIENGQADFYIEVQTSEKNHEAVFSFYLHRTHKETRD